MKTLSSILSVFTILLAGMFVSCSHQGNQSTPAYRSKLYRSHDKAYEVEIPTDYSERNSIGDFMVFSDENTASFITIQPLPQGESLSSFAKKNGGYAYTVIEQSDTTLYYSLHMKSENPFTYAIYNPHELYRTKTLEGGCYVITVSSAKLGESEAIRQIRHVHHSLTAYSAELHVKRL